MGTTEKKSILNGFAGVIAGVLSHTLRPIYYTTNQKDAGVEGEMLAKR